MEQITLDMIPGSYTPTAHVSQYDSGRHIRFDLKHIVLAGNETVTLKIRKTNGKLITKTIENHTAYVEYISEKADCDYSGTANCEIVISKDNTVLGSKNFLMKVEADAYDGAGVVTETASGQIATFETNMVDVLQEVKCDINATGGNGTPDNPIPINGYTEANITRCGVNIWDEVWETGSINDDGTLDDSSWATTNRIRSTNYTLVTPDTSYYFVWTSEQTNAVRIYFYDVNKTFISYYQINFSSSKTFTTPSNCKYIKWRSAGSNSVVTSNNDISINYPATDTTYHAYNGQTYTIAFGQTVYGGVLDVTRGKLHVTHGKYTLDNTATAGQFDINTFADRNRFSYVPYQSDGKTNGTFKADKLETASNAPGGIGTGDYQIFGSTTAPRMWITVPTTIATVADFLTYISSNPIEVVYELSTPFDIDLTPEQIEALLGVNNVWHDANGDTEVKFLEVVRN